MEPPCPGSLPRVLLSTHMGQRAGGNVACEKEALCSQDLEHCSAEGARPQFSTVPLCSFQLVDTWDSARMSTASRARWGEQGQKKGAKRDLERGKAIIENLCSQPISGPHYVGATILGRPFMCLFHHPGQTDPRLLELRSEANHVGLHQADAVFAGLPHLADRCPLCDSDSVPSQLPTMGHHQQHLAYSRDGLKPPTNCSKSHLLSPCCPLVIPPHCPQAMRLRRNGGGDSTTQTVTLLAVLPRRRCGCPSFGSTVMAASESGLE